jgi:hypothetical protein
MKILYINPKQPMCGVHQYGKRVAEILQQDTRYELIYQEVQTESAEEFYSTAVDIQPTHIIWNRNNGDFPWLHTISPYLTQKQIAIHHENELPHGINWDALLCADLLENIQEKKYALPRPLYENKSLETASNDVITIGSFGFGFSNKGMERLVQRVCDEYDEAVINLHLTAAFYGDPNGSQMTDVSKKCEELVSKPGIKLNITHDFISNEEILNFLNKNDINIFMYDEMHGRGLSSAVDYALSVDRPLAVNGTWMFRHLWSENSEINLDNHSIADIVALGTNPLKFFQKKWSNQEMRDKVYSVLMSV